METCGNRTLAGQGRLWEQSRSLSVHPLTAEGRIVYGMGCPDPRGPRGTRVSAAGIWTLVILIDGKKETSPCRSPGTCHLEIDGVSRV